MTLFEWDPKYSVKVKEIDEQHNQYLKIVKKLSESLGKENSKDVTTQILNELTDFANYHFSTEEKYFKKFNYEDAENHIKEHRNFAEKIDFIKKKHINGQEEVSFELIDYLEDWLLEHLADYDQKYSKCFNEHGLF